MSNFENIIFDFDGTLVDTQIDIKESFKEAINKVKGEDINYSFFRIGPPLEEMIRNYFTGVSTEEVKEIITTFRFVYSNCGFNHTKCYSGIETLLKRLKKDHKKVYVATNKPGYLTKTIIEKLNIPYFDDIFTIDKIKGFSLSKRDMVTLLIKENKLNSKLSVMIGDSSSDIRSASQNGITSVGVGYGYESKEQILTEHPDFYFDTVLQLTNFLSN